MLPPTLAQTTVMLNRPTGLCHALAGASRRFTAGERYRINDQRSTISQITLGMWGMVCTLFGATLFGAWGT